MRPLDAFSEFVDLVTLWTVIAYGVVGVVAMFTADVFGPLAAAAGLNLFYQAGARLTDPPEPGGDEEDEDEEAAA